MKVCQHFAKIKDDPEVNKKFNLLFSVVARSRIRDEKFFEATHQPIVAYKRLRGTDRSVAPVAEEDILKEVMASKSRNHTSLIVGIPGTGKSELCAYIYLNLLKGGVPHQNCLYLDRSIGLPEMLSILDSRYREITGKALPGNSLEKIKQTRDYPELNAMRIVSKVLMDSGLGRYFETDERATNAFKSFTAQRLRAILSDNTNPEVPAERDFLTAADLEAGINNVWSSKIAESGRKKQDLVREINEHFVKALRSYTNTTNIKDALWSIASVLNGRLFVIFEDFALSDVEGAEISRFMESDEEGGCEFLIAGIGEKLNIVLTQTALERYDIYYMEDESKGSGSLFLSEDTAGSFTEKYFRYWKTVLNPVDDPICEKLEGLDRTLFPFNENFVKRLYLGLRKKNPRQFIRAMQLILEEYSKGTAPMSSRAIKANADYSMALREFPDLNYDSAIETLLGWFGYRRDDGSIEVAKFYADVFVISTQSGRVEVTDDAMLVFGKAKQAIKDSETKQGPQELTRGPTYIPPPVHVDPEELKIPNWRENTSSHDYSAIGSNMVEGTRIALNWLSDRWRITGYWSQLEGPPLSYDYATSSSISFRGEGADIELHATDFTIEDLKTLYRLGKRKISIKTGDDSVLRILPIELSVRMDEWRERKWEELLSTSGGSIDFRLFPRYIAQFICQLETPFKTLDSRDFALAFSEWRHKTDDRDFYENLRTNGNGKAMKEAFSLIPQAEVFKDALFGIFQLQHTYDGSVLKEDVWPESASLRDPLSLISDRKFSKLISEIDNRYKVKVGEGQVSLKDVLKEIKHTADEIQTTFDLKINSDDFKNFRKTAKFVELCLNGLELDTFRGRVESLKGITSYKSLVSDLLTLYGMMSKERNEELCERISVTTNDLNAPPWLIGLRKCIVESDPIYAAVKAISTKYAEFNIDYQVAKARGSGPSEQNKKAMDDLLGVLENV